jgi:hypothetical protein
MTSAAENKTKAVSAEFMNGPSLLRKNYDEDFLNEKANFVPSVI